MGCCLSNDNKKTVHPSPNDVLFQQLPMRNCRRYFVFFFSLVDSIFLSVIKCVCCSTGETLKHDINFKGPLSKRSCTDVLCLLIFIVFLGCWGFVAHYGKFFLSFVLWIFHTKNVWTEFFSQHFCHLFNEMNWKNSVSVIKNFYYSNSDKTWRFGSFAGPDGFSGPKMWCR